MYKIYIKDSERKKKDLSFLSKDYMFAMDTVDEKGLSVVFSKDIDPSDLLNYISGLSFLLIGLVKGLYYSNISISSEEILKSINLEEFILKRLKEGDTK